MSAAVLAVTVFLAAILPGPERLVTPPSFGVGYGQQYSSDLASDGTGFLALWIEQSPGRDGLYAAAIDERGSARPLPPRMIARGHIHEAHVVWAGDAYLVVWGDNDTRQLFAVRVSRDGEPIGEPAVIGEGLVPVGLAWNGRNALAVVISDDFKKLVLSLAGDGTVERRTTLPIARGDGSAITVAAAGDTFVVTWIEIVSSPTTAPNMVKAMRFDRRGVSLDVAPAALPLVGDLRNGVSSISADSDGERVGLAFIARSVDGAEAPWWETLHTFTIDARTTAIAATASRAVISDVDVVATPRGFLAATQSWKDGQAVLVLTPFDDSAATEITIPESGANEFMFARSAGAVMAVWADLRLGRHLFGVALNESATRAVGQVGPVAFPAIAQVNPIIAPAGGQALVVWIELFGPDYGDVMAMRVDADGNALDAPFVIGRGAYAGYRMPAAVFTGQVWLVAWTTPTQGARTVIRRVSTDGRLLDATDELRATSYAMATNGSVSVLASRGTDGISLTRFSPEGGLLDTMQAPARAGYEADLATNGQEFLLVWMEVSDQGQSPSPNYRDVMAVRLDAGGMVLGSPIAVSNGARDEGEPMVAGSDGGDFLVLYSLDKSTVRAKRVSREGVAGDEMLVANDSLPVAVTRVRSGYIAAFANGYESGTALISTVQLDRSGAPTGPPALISRSEAPWREMSLGVLNGSPVAVYSRSVAGPPFENVPRLFMRTLKESARRRSVR